MKQVSIGGVQVSYYTTSMTDNTITAVPDEEQQWYEYALRKAHPSRRPGWVRMRFDPLTIEAAIRAVAVRCAFSLPHHSQVTREACEAFLTRLLRSRLRLVRAEMKRRDASMRLYLSPSEVVTLKEGLEVIHNSWDFTDAEERLLLRCTAISQATQAGLKPRSELIRMMNLKRSAKEKRLAPVKPQAVAVHPASMRVRIREWTVRAAIFAIAWYMRYHSDDISRKRAYRLLNRLVRLQRGAIVSQIRHGKSRDSSSERKTATLEANKQAYITPRLSIWELRMIREGLELRNGELARAEGVAGIGGGWGRWQLNPTEQALLLKVTLLYNAYYGVGGPQGRAMSKFGLTGRLYTIRRKREKDQLAGV